MQTTRIHFFKAYTPPTNEYNQFHHLALKVKTEKLHVNYLPPRICGSGSMQIIFFHVQVANMRKLYKRKIYEFNENFYSVHTQILINNGSMTCEKQEMQYHRYLASIH